MKKNYRLISGLLFLFVIFPFFSCSRKIPEAADVKIIPKPLELTKQDGIFRLDKRTSFYLADSTAALQKAAEIFAGYVNTSSSFVLTPEFRRDLPGGRRAIVVLLHGDQNRFGREGYSLKVQPEKVTITATTPAGAFYGMQTLRQLFPPQLEDSSYTADVWQLPCVTIFDKPRFAWRGDMLDVSRHFLPLEFIRKNLDYLARYKMNTFHWHLTDDQGWRIEVKGYPKLTKIGAWRVDYNKMPWWGRPSQKPGEKATYGGYYTQDQIREVVKYAADRFITVVPEIDMPGHSRATIASYPEIACGQGPYYVATGGVASNNTICPAKEESYRFIKGVLSEVLPLFPGPWFHVGGDECNKTNWKTNRLCRDLMKKEGMKNVEELQSYFIRRVEKIVNGLGKKLIGWDEILQGGLAPNAAVMSWRGEQGGIRAAKMGHKVVMTPTKYCYLDLKQGDPELEPLYGYSQCLLSTAYSYNPVSESLLPEEAKLVLGTQGNLWGESIKNEKDANYMLFPRLLAIAEVGWTPKALRTWDDFVNRLEYSLIRLKNLGIGYAPSMYNVRISSVQDSVRKGLLIRLSTEHGRVPIRYTLDGSVPLPASPLYQGPIEITGKEVKIKAAAFRHGKIIGRITTKIFRIHKAAGMEVQVSIPPSPKYNPGTPILTDCLRGGVDAHNGRWLGWEGVSPVITLDLGKADTVHRVTVGCLQAQGAWIFLPKEVKVFVSAGGKHFMTRGILHRPLKNQPEPRAVDLVLKIPPTKARYVRILVINRGDCPDWHPGAGQKAWVFIDEVLVE
ncbi:MAG: family 20 glycosylhydrolase [Bacteroidales bacterium]|nr:family 20 glycosylhydrolase [Bacteroidales bacterium]